MVAQQWLTVEQIAERLQVTEETVRRWLRSGSLRGRNFSGRTGYRVREEDLQELLESIATPKRDPATESVFDGYCVDDQVAVSRALDNQPSLLRLLSQVIDVVPNYFDEAQLHLSVAQDPEAADEQLVVRISTTLPETEAMDRLGRFDEEWWLDRLPEADDKLCITLGFE